MITPNDLFESLDGKNDNVNKLFLKYINNEVREMKLPMVKLHGDLWSSNILLKKGNSSKFYYIDWEYSNDYFFFYDLFWFMQNEAIYNGNFTFIKKYINGRYDDQFINIFRTFDLDFREEHRQGFLVIFFFNILKTRLVNADQTTINKEHNQFIVFLRKLNN